MSGGNALIEDFITGRWKDPETGKPPPDVPFRSILIEPSLDGREADLVASVGLTGRLAVVSDENTYEALGRRVEQALAAAGAVDSIVLDSPHADMATAKALCERTTFADGLVAVGAGTVNDLCKYASFLHDRGYAVFATAPSMNGYTTSTASITVEGVKRSLKAQGARGAFFDLEVNAAAPVQLVRSGFGDCMCRSTAQVDWLLSHLLKGTYYSDSPFLIQEAEEGPLLDSAAALVEGDLEAVSRLIRVLVLCGLGVCLTGTTHHGSMSEHLISHYIDMVAGERHPGTLHGEQVGVAALSMNRLQNQIVNAETPPRVAATEIDEAAVLARFGPASGPACLREFRNKALSEEEAEAINARLSSDWSSIRERLKAALLTPERLSGAMAAAGAPMTGESLGLPTGFYSEAVLHAREIRDRFSILDVAGDADLLQAFAAGEC
ncbi:MAG: iron-containing alcohol dehydrogenase [Kiloniellales bacterium]|nr:iron-containing alcohol dehydrogenase [Kiloniellales bacterium]